MNISMAEERINGIYAAGGKLISPVGGFDRLTDSLFQKFGALIYEKTGIYLKPEKKELLNARLGKRLRACGIGSFKQYYEYVLHDKSGEELINLIDCVSTNFTSFFREQSHFEFLTSTALPSLMEDRKVSRKNLTFWSAACSSGEEPYTLAMVLENFFENHSGWHYKIMATDISTRVLAQARRGVYSYDRITKVPPLFLKKYFQKGVGKSEGYVKIKEMIRQKLSFDRFNLMGHFPWQSELDVIFCRNVMIYFNRQTQQELVGKFYKALKPGGYLFIGHSESITSLNHNFEQRDATAYRK